MSIPLVQNNEKDSINTSIIAIKRNIERINMLLGLSNSEEIDTSEFVKKSDIVDVVEAGNMNPVTSNAVVPVDEVTLGNMQSVSSDGVAKAFGGEWETLWTGSNDSFVKGIKTKMGKFLRIRFNNVFGGNKSNGALLLTITNTDYLPTLSPCRFVFTIDTTSNTRMNASVDFLNDGRMVIFFQDRVSYTEQIGVAGCFCDALVLVL